MKISKTSLMKIFTIVRTSYPNSYKNTNENDITALIDTWYYILKDYEKEVVEQAFIDCLKTCKYPPTIADVNEKIETYLKANVEDDTAKLWQELKKAVNKTSDLFYYNGRTFYANGNFVEPYKELRQTFKGLNDVIKEYLGNESILRDLANADTLEYERVRFIKAVSGIKEMQKVRLGTKLLKNMLENKQKSIDFKEN